jgi:hypothetical protein
MEDREAQLFCISICCAAQLSSNEGGVMALHHSACPMAVQPAGQLFASDANSGKEPALS